MALTITTDAREVAALLDPLIASDPVRHTIFGTIRDSLGGPDAVPWCAWSPGAPGVLASGSLPDRPVSVTSGWPEVTELADALAGRAHLAGVRGPVATVDAVSKALAERGYDAVGRMDERLFRLDTLVEPVLAPGSARPATIGDVALLTRWQAGFAAEAHGTAMEPATARRIVESQLGPRRYWLWCTPDGEPASYAVRQPVIHGVARIGPVYTPVRFRGRGFGSAVTAAATHDALAAGAVPVLFTDLANPTSNKIYVALGYRPVEDGTELRFT